MKKTKECLILVMIISIILSMCSALFNKAYADENNTPNNQKSFTALAGLTNNKYNFHPADVLAWAAHVGTNSNYNGTYNEQWPFVPTEVTANALEKKELIPLDGEDASDNATNAKDSANLQHLRKNADNSNRFDIAGSLSRKLGISENDINVKVYYTLPECNGEKLLSVANNSEDNWKTIDKQFLDKVFENARKCSTSGKYNNMDLGSGNTSDLVKFETAEEFESKYNKLKAGATEAYNNLNSITAETDAVRALCDDYDSLSEAEIEELRDRYAKYAMCIGQIDVTLKNGEETESCYRNYLFDIISADAELPDGSIYRLVIGTGTVNGVSYDHHWLMERVKGSDQDANWATELDYKSEPQGQMSSDGKTYLPPYVENDKNVKDVDVVAYITSKTEEEIIATNGNALTADNVKETPNKDGWYYPDVDNKKVIAKDYPFDDYDNTTYNGIVNENVKLTGNKGGKSEQDPSIKWTFRRKVIEYTENTDRSTTVVITYNLPINVNKIPDGWSVIYDNDGKTSHKITRTFTKDENYDKDVPAYQNETDVEVITPVKVKAVPTAIAKAGQSMMIVALIAIIAVVAIARYRKMKKYRKI